MFITVLILSIFVFTAAAHAHFGMVIPSDSMVMQGENRNIGITLSFSHPFEGEGMELVKPQVFEVTFNGKSVDLRDSLQTTQVMGHSAWETNYRLSRPGVYTFHMTPHPYWEPAEDCFIVHYTKTVVAFHEDEGWDEEIGLKTEIVPLSKPYGLYAGNLFQGIVNVNGKPVPYAEVEVEYYNENQDKTAPSDFMITQTVKADANGVFSYAVPGPGWWGFAALNTADEKIKLDGVEKDVEIGAVIWVQFHEF